MENDKDPKNYELAILVKAEDQLAEIAVFLAQHQATVSGEPRVKKLALAYPVKKQREAIFASYLFSAVSLNAKQLEKDLAVRQDILRFMIIITPKAKGSTMPVGDIPFARRRPAKTISRPAPTPAPAQIPAKQVGNLSNEALEKKIEEILQ